MNVLSLFSGYGGLDMAVTAVLGGRVAWHVDNDPAASKVLEHHWSDTPNLGDITTVDWARVEPVDVICGGWPCQPFSFAGKRRGADDDRALWPYVADAVRVVRPRYVLLENVPGVITAGELQRVASDLAALGYVGSWTCLRASDVGAPHKRERIFIAAADATRHGHERAGPARNRWPGPSNGDVTAADASGGKVRPQPVALAGCVGAAVPGLDREAAPDPDGTVPYSERNGEPTESEQHAPLGLDAAGRVLDWGPYTPAIHRWAAIVGRPAPAPTVAGRRGNVLNPELPEWMHGLPAGHVTHAPGLSRNDMLRLLGNGVVPIQATAAFEHLLPKLAEVTT